MVHPIWNDYPSVQAGLIEVKKIIKEGLRIDHPQVKEKINDYLDGSGKFVRAGLVLLLAQASDGKIEDSKLYFAASIEVLHLATLIHDDVIDQADTRRGLETLHSTFSNRIAVYAGDYLLAYSSRLAVMGSERMKNAGSEDKNLPFDHRLIERILAGELAQLMNQYQYDMTMKAYLKQIKGKTAFLFALSCQSGVSSFPTHKENLRLAYQAGLAIGMAFQLSDDLLDYRVSKEQMGKPALQDIQNGIYTAPLLLAMQKDQELVGMLKNQGERTWSDELLTEVEERISKTGAYNQTQLLVDKYLKKCQSALSKLELTNLVDMQVFLEKLMKRNF